jgi:RNA polymerase sigma-70 factor (ECF subfamily)
MTDAGKRFANQAAVRGPWRRYLDSLVQYRPDLHRYCRRLTGNVWDGEDLMQDTLVRVFSLLGKIDANLENPRAYLIRTATNLWIDRVRRSAREQAALALEIPETTAHSDTAEQRDAAKALFQSLHPQERADLVLKDVFDYSLEETASMLRTSVGAVKSALNRGRGRLEAKRPSAGFEPPPREIVEKFMVALRDKDTETMRALCADDFALELVGGAQGEGWEQNRNFFTHAHMTMPRLGFGLNPRWELADYAGETLLLGFRTLDGVEGLNEIHRLEVAEDKVLRIRCYCFCPETVRAVAEDLGLTPLWRPHRSPDMFSALMMLTGLKRRPRQMPVGRPIR